MARKIILLAGIACLLAAGLCARLISPGLGASILFYSAVTAIGAIGFVLVAFGITTMIIAWRIRKGRWRPRLQYDAPLARYNWAFRELTLVALLLAFNCSTLLNGFWKHPDDEPHMIVTVVGTVSAFCAIWSYALQLSARFRNEKTSRLIKDEFFQDNLAKSRSDAFYALLAMLTACFFTGLLSERLAISLLPIAAAVSVAFGGWRFNRRDAKALDGE